jgi:hypothetical protein
MPTRISRTGPVSTSDSNRTCELNFVLNTNYKSSESLLPTNGIVLTYKVVSSLARDQNRYFCLAKAT